MKCLITGCEGFVGSHLADLLVAKGLDVSATVFSEADNIAHLEGRIAILDCDLRDRNRVEEIIDEVSPDFVFHLAAQSFVTVSWQRPEDTLHTNVLGTHNLMESLKRSRRRAKILAVGSSAVYGPCRHEEMPLGEIREFRPTSVYAVSKVAEDMLSYFYWRVFGMEVIRVRPFSMTGPRKQGDVCSDFAKGIAEVERGRRSILDVGNLEAVRDFTDGRDAVNALWLLAERGTPGEVYNICSGKGYQVGSILEILVALSKKRIPVQAVPERLRPFDDPMYVGDNSKLRALGWEPRIPLERTLTDLLDWWREKLGRIG